MITIHRVFHAHLDPVRNVNRCATQRETWGLEQWWSLTVKVLPGRRG